MPTSWASTSAARRTTGAPAIAIPRRRPRLPSVFPASSPYALACGGTQFENDSPTGTRAETGALVETVWNRDNRGLQQATGGGVSGRWEIPDFQADAAVPAHGALNGPAWISTTVPPEERAAFRGRGIPDVAALADTLHGYEVLVTGQRTVIGGTSLATPLWASLLACLSQQLGQPVRWIQELIYQESFQQCFGSLEKGDNQLPNAQAIAYFDTRADVWDGCCGLGTPDGEKLLECLQRVIDRDVP